MIKDISQKRGVLDTLRDWLTIKEKEAGQTLWIPNAKKHKPVVSI
ncbi:hypothetical protein EPICR_20266 [Candidatus Desulfarcum epimagneticum]|uniref:Uncharacterized protein n=1 Tax=uncultured Desulfobacteraceae bacterium TaxID=218296 RepID=A0A484HEU2_9BACT|nr:hypothetical protein EPICR_20266 [uncultured Desulfobacteraceae bacterium]